jgi:hypothetical protein
MENNNKILTVGSFNTLGDAYSGGTKKHIVFCNGIECPPEKAIESGKLISDAFGDSRIVHIVHNPTRAPGYFNYQSKTQTDLVAEVSKRLINLLNGGMDGILHTHPMAVIENHGRVVIFAHSHGTVIVKQALSNLSDYESHISESDTYCHLLSVFKNTIKEIAAKTLEAEKKALNLRESNTIGYYED